MHELSAEEIHGILAPKDDHAGTMFLKLLTVAIREEQTNLNAIGLHRRNEVSLETIVAEVKRNPDAKKAGALASFTGIVREDPLKTSVGKVRSLQYEAYEELALRKLEEIRADLVRREGIVDVWIHHVVDNLAVGDESLFVVVLGDHRQHTFPVLEEAVERVKNEVPIWKKEVAESDAYWVSGH